MSFNSIDHEARSTKKRNKILILVLLPRKKKKERKKKSKKQKNKTGKKNGVLGVNIKRKVYDILNITVYYVCV